jgi:hypothetical protein
MINNQRVIIQSERDDKSTDDILWWLSYLDQSANITCVWGNHSIEKLSIALDSVNGVKLRINDQIITSEDNFWYRRGEFINGLKDRSPNKGKEFDRLLENSSNYTYKPIFRSVSNWNFSRGVGTFSNNAITKLDILQIALKHGLLIPSTLVTGSKKELLKFLELNNLVLTKPLNNPFTGYNLDSQFSLKVAIKTRVLDKDSLGENIPQHFVSSLFQEYINKKVEIRSFVLRDKVFSMAIFSQNNEKTKIDYRNYDRKRPNRNVPFKLPRNIELKLIGLTKSLGLETGSADIILTPDNRYVFLEINPIGQFQWLSRHCNYCLEKQLAQVLLNPTHDE